MTAAAPPVARALLATMSLSFVVGAAGRVR